MNPLIEQHLEEIAALCNQFGVRKLELFGSACRGEFDPGTSDLDFIADFTDIELPGYGLRYLEFAEALEEVLGRKIDILTANASMNRFFRQSIDECRVTVHEAKRRIAVA